MPFLLLSHLRVQNANAVSGLTWGFPAVTHFLGFAHHLSRRIAAEDAFAGLQIGGCGIVAHDHHAHTFGDFERSFTQYRSQPSFHGMNKKSVAPPIIEEGKMNLTVSLLLEIEGGVGSRQEDLCSFVQQCCLTQRLAGGLILSVGEIRCSSDERQLQRLLMPGFALMDRSSLLEAHLEALRDEAEEGKPVDPLQAWLDFSILKRAARPAHEAISRHLQSKAPDLVSSWEEHLSVCPYDPTTIPSQVHSFMETIPKEKAWKKLIDEWENYQTPSSKTPAQWEILPKAFPGYLVPLMTGYKAISPVYQNQEVEHTRDGESPVCFVESVHTIGEWKSPHRLKALRDILWHYTYEAPWYLCTQHTVLHPADNVAEEAEEDL